MNSLSLFKVLAPYTFIENFMKLFIFSTSSKKHCIHLSGNLLSCAIWWDLEWISGERVEWGWLFLFPSLSANILRKEEGHTIILRGFRKFLEYVYIRGRYIMYNISLLLNIYTTLMYSRIFYCQARSPLREGVIETGIWGTRWDWVGEREINDVACRRRSEHGDGWMFKIPPKSMEKMMWSETWFHLFHHCSSSFFLLPSSSLLCHILFLLFRRASPFFPFTKNIFSHLIPSTLTSTFNEKLTFKSKLKKKVFSRWAVSVTLWPNHVSKQVSHIFTPKKNRKWREMWDFCKKKYKLGKRVFRTSLQKSTPLLTIYFSTNYFHRIIHN